MFSNYLNERYTVKELLGAIHYIEPRVISRNFIGENRYEIKDKYGYFKNAFKTNIRKFKKLGRELYPEDLNDSFWIEEVL